MYDGGNTGGGYPPNPNQNPNQAPGLNPYPQQNPTPNPAPRVVPAPPPMPSQAPAWGPTTGKAMVADYWFKRHWKMLALILLGLVILGQTIFQIVYPSSRLIPGVYVDDVDLGWMKYSDAAKKLDEEYGNLKLNIYFGTNNAAFQSPKFHEVGIGVDNTARLEKIEYPFFLRFIPGSIFWAPALSSPGQIAYKYDREKIINYTLTKVGEDCSIPPTNATLRLVDSQLQLVPSITGGNCDLNEFQQALMEVKPDAYKDNQVRIAIDETPAPVTDDMARDLAQKLNSRMAEPMPITVDKETDTIPGRVVLSWLDFTAVVPEKSIDNTGNQQASLKFSVNQKRMEDYLKQGIASKLIKEPGVSKVTTHDFTEKSRVNGANGRGLDVPRIAKSVEDYINNKIQRAIGATVVVGPTTEYKRTYSPTSVGFSALLAHFANDNPGTYSMAFQELSAVEHPRSAQYRGDAQMPAAGVHSLYLGMTDIMEQYAGKSRPVDKISGDMSATDCFKFMLERFDLNCRVGFYNHYGHATLTSYAKQFGLKSTVFTGEDTVTSANDLQRILVGVYKNQIARKEGGQRIMTPLRANRESRGLPATAETNQISHVTGEGDKVYNDSAIIYSTNYGAYALTIMSHGEGTSWEKIAELGKKILELKSVKIPKDAR